MSRFYTIATVLRSRALFRLTYTPLSNTGRWLADIRDATKYVSHLWKAATAHRRSWPRPIPPDSKPSASKRWWEAALIKQKKQKGVSASDSHEKRNAALLGSFNGKRSVVIFLVKMAQRHVCLDTGKLQRTIWERQFWDISGLELRWIWSVLKGEAQHTGFLHWTQRGEI